ncbi:MAG: hydroxyacid dehydrogenase [Armatimonadota bacterium]|nr:hydroxyacid dehydrogenase [Armatimonadota bacterium]
MTTRGVSGSERPRIAFVLHPSYIGRLVSEEAVARLRSFAELRLPEPDIRIADQAPELLADADGCLMGWGSPCLEGKLLEAANRLQILAYAAGSVRPVVSQELFSRGVVVTSAAAANADEVATYALGAILLACKGVFPSSLVTRTGGWGGEAANDVTGRTVGIVGSGHVGRCVLRLLKSIPNGMKVLLYDPYVTVEAAAAMGATKVELTELLSQSHVVSLHAPSIPATNHMINASNLPLLQDRAALINTARGTLIDPVALAAELERRPTLQAVIDVTDPDEPPPAGHPFRTLPNVILTPHIAGAVAGAQQRMGDLAVDELHRHFVTHEPPLHPVTAAMMEFIA